MEEQERGHPTLPSSGFPDRHPAELSPSADTCRLVPMAANDEVPLPNCLTSLYISVSPDSTAGLAGGVTVGRRKVALGVAPRGSPPRRISNI